MLDIKWMREHRAELADAMQKLNAVDAPWEKALALDEERRDLLTQVEACAQNAISARKKWGRSSAKRRPPKPTRLRIA